MIPVMYLLPRWIYATAPKTEGGGGKPGNYVDLSIVEGCSVLINGFPMVVGQALIYEPGSRIEVEIKPYEGLTFERCEIYGGDQWDHDTTVYEDKFSLTMPQSGNVILYVFCGKCALVKLNGNGFDKLSFCEGDDKYLYNGGERTVCSSVDEMDTICCNFSTLPNTTVNSIMINGEEMIQKFEIRDEEMIDWEGDEHKLWDYQGCDYEYSNPSFLTQDPTNITISCDYHKESEANKLLLGFIQSIVDFQDMHVSMNGQSTSISNIFSLSSPNGVSEEVTLSFKLGDSDSSRALVTDLCVYDLVTGKFTRTPIAPPDENGVYTYTFVWDSDIYIYLDHSNLKFKQGVAFIADNNCGWNWLKITNLEDGDFKYVDSETFEGLCEDYGPDLDEGIPCGYAYFWNFNNVKIEGELKEGYICDGIYSTSNPDYITPYRFLCEFPYEGKLPKSEPSDGQYYLLHTIEVE